MLHPEQKSALHYAEVSRRFAEGTHAEVQEVGGVNSAKIWAEKAMSAAEFNGGNLLKSKGDLIVGGDNGVYQRLPIGQPGEAPVADIGPDGQIGLRYRPFNMPRMTFRADEGVRLFPGHEYVITQGEADEVTLVAPEKITSNDDCRMRIIYAGRSAGYEGYVPPLSLTGGEYYSTGKWENSYRLYWPEGPVSVELSCVDLKEDGIARWVVVSTGFDPEPLKKAVRIHNEMPRAHGYQLAANTTMAVTDGSIMYNTGTPYTFIGSGMLAPILIRDATTGRCDLACVSDKDDVRILRSGTEAGARHDTEYGGKLMYVWIIPDTLAYAEELNQFPFVDVLPDTPVETRRNLAVIFTASTACFSRVALADGAGRNIAMTYTFRDLSNTAGHLDFVVESGHDASGWFRRYRSGWLEQGGGFPQAYDYISGTVQLLKPFQTTAYCVQITGDTEGSESWGVSVYSKTTTGFNYAHVRNLTQAAGWYACGQGA